VPEGWHEASSTLRTVSIWSHRRRFSCQNDLAPDICVPLPEATNHQRHNNANKKLQYCVTNFAFGRWQPRTVKQFQLRDAPAAALLNLNMAIVGTPELCHSFGIQRDQTPNASSAIGRKSKWMKTTLLLHMWLGLKESLEHSLSHTIHEINNTFFFQMRITDETNNKYKLTLTTTLRNNGYVIYFRLYDKIYITYDLSKLDECIDRTDSLWIKSNFRYLYAAANPTTVVLFQIDF